MHVIIQGLHQQPTHPSPPPFACICKLSKGGDGGSRAGGGGLASKNPPQTWRSKQQSSLTPACRRTCTPHILSANRDELSTLPQQGGSGGLGSQALVLASVQHGRQMRTLASSQTRSITSRIYLGVSCHSPPFPTTLLQQQL